MFVDILLSLFCKSVNYTNHRLRIQWNIAESIPIGIYDPDNIYVRPFILGIRVVCLSTYVFDKLGYNKVNTVYFILRPFDVAIIQNILSKFIIINQWYKNGLWGYVMLNFEVS